MVGRIRRWWCKTAHQGSLGVCQEKPPNWHAHKFYSAHYTQTYTKIQRQTHRQIRIFQCAPTLKHENLHQAYSCLLQFTNIKKSVQSQQLMAESCQRRDFRLQHCYLLQFTLSLFSELVHQSWNRILHFINPAKGSFQPHHNAPLMSEDSLMYSFKPSNPLDKICKGGIYKRSTEENWLLSRTCLRCVCTVLRRTNYLYFRNIYFVLFTRPLAIVGHPGHSITRMQVMTMMIDMMMIICSNLENSCDQ